MALRSHVRPKAMLLHPFKVVSHPFFTLEGATTLSIAHRNGA
jgi:hypothetical protein